MYKYNFAARTASFWLKRILVSVLCTRSSSLCPCHIAQHNMVSSWESLERYRDVPSRDVLTDWWPCAFCDYWGELSLTWEFDNRKRPRFGGAPVWQPYGLEHQRALTEAVIIGGTHVQLNDIWSVRDVWGTWVPQYDVDLQAFVQERLRTGQRRRVRLCQYAQARRTLFVRVITRPEPVASPPNLALLREISALCAMCRSFEGIPMGWEHDWCTQRNHIMDCADVLIEQHLLPKSLWGKRALVMKISSFVAAPLKMIVPVRLYVRRRLPSGCVVHSSR